MTTPHTPGRPRRPGFTLVELMIAMAIVAIIGAAFTKLIVNQSRFYDKQVQQRAARGVSRSALNVLQADLRMIEESRGLSTASTTTLQAWVPFGVGVVCGANTIHLMPIDSLVLEEVKAGTAELGLSVRDMTNGTYPNFSTTTMSPISSTLLCTGNGVTPLPNGTMWTTSASLGGAWAGQPLMVYRRITYRLATSGLVTGGKYGLFRQVGTGTDEELVAPLETTSKFEYYALNSSVPGAAPADLRQVYGVRFNLIGMSERKTQQNAAQEKSNLITSVFFKNRKL